MSQITSLETTGCWSRFSAIYNVIQLRYFPVSNTKSYYTRDQPTVIGLHIPYLILNSIAHAVSIVPGRGPWGTFNPMPLIMKQYVFYPGLSSITIYVVKHFELIKNLFYENFFENFRTPRQNFCRRPWFLPCS